MDAEREARRMLARRLVELEAENERLRQALAKYQEPQGQRDAAVADWLRQRGWIVSHTAQCDKSATV